MSTTILKPDLVYLLSRNYFIGLHLIERLEEICELPLLNKAQRSIKTAIRELEKQATEMIGVLDILCPSPDLSSAQAAIDLLESLFNLFYQNEMGVKEIYLLDYVLLADAIMKATFDSCKALCQQSSYIAYRLEVFYDPAALSTLISVLTDQSLRATNQL